MLLLKDLGGTARCLLLLKDLGDTALLTAEEDTATVTASQVRSSSRIQSVDTLRG